MKRILTLFLVLAMALPNVRVAHASDEVQSEFQAEVNITADATEYSVVLPVRLDAYVAANGDVITPSAAKVRNYSIGAIYVKSVNIITAEGWELVPYDEDFTEFPDDTRNIGIHLNGDYATDNQDNTRLLLSPAAWPIVAGTTSVSSIPISYSLKMPKQNGQLDESPLSVIMVVDWYDENAEERPSAHFDLVGGYMPIQGALIPGQLAPEPSVEPIRNGYNFLGWYTDRAYTQEWDFNADIVSPYTVIYAKWEEKEKLPVMEFVTLTLYDNDSQLITSIQVPKGELLDIPTIDVPVGKVLEGWYVDSEYTTAWDFGTALVEADMSLYAKFEDIPPQGSTVTLDLFGGLIEGDTEFTVPVGDTIGSVPTPTAGGATFDQWYADEGRSIPWNTESDTVTSDMTLYAGWTLNLADWEYTDNGGKTLLTKYSGSSSHVVIPERDTTNGKDVLVEFGEVWPEKSKVFSEKSDTVTSIFFEDGVRYRNNSMEYAFSGLSKLESVNIIPEGVTDLSYVFSGCASLTTAPNIPEGVTNLSNTFKGCASLITAPTIPAGVTNLFYTFEGCASLTTAPTIPVGVTGLSNAFKGCTSLTTAPILPEGVTSLFFTFQGCTSLTTVPNIPESVISITSAFSGCTSLTTAPTIPEGVTTLSNAFLGCTSLTVAPTIPASVTSLSGTFRDCTSLTVAPTIPASVANLSGTFQDCTSLTTAPVIPTSVTNINSTFYNCTNLTGTITISAEAGSYANAFKDAGKNAADPIKLKAANGVTTTYLNNLISTKGDGKVELAD